MLYEKCQRLAEYPEMGRARYELLVNLRSFTVKNYVSFYQPIRDGIEMLRVLHGARDIHRVFDEMVGEPSDERRGRFFLHHNATGALLRPLRTQAGLGSADRERRGRPCMAHSVIMTLPFSRVAAGRRTGAGIRAA